MKIGMLGFAPHHAAYLSTRAIASLERIANSGNCQEAIRKSDLVSGKGLPPRTMTCLMRKM